MSGVPLVTLESMASEVEPVGGRLLVAGSGLGIGPAWRDVLDRALDAALLPLAEATADLLVLFANTDFAADYPAMLARTGERTGARNVVGCSGSGVIGGDREAEQQASIAVLAVCLPDRSYLTACALGPDQISDALTDAPAWPRLLGMQPSACTGILVLADPYTANPEEMVSSLQSAYPGVPIVGGLASGLGDARGTYVFEGERSLAQGAVLVAFSGRVALRPVVSQGCEPIGEAWTITDVDGYLVKKIGNRPAFEVLRETLLKLEPAARQRASSNLLVGLAMDEYRESHGRGDYLIRNILGADQSTGVIAVGAHPRVGQTLQFQVRDARAADDELRHLLAGAAEELSGAAPAALLFACNGRGTGLFGVPDHDARAASEILGAPALAGFFCNGEIGPVGRGTYLHGFTASLGLIVTKDR